MNINVENLRKLMVNKTDKRCFVIGDIILDKYVSGEIPRISPEAPIPVMRVQDEKIMLGGAANVAGNISAFHIQTYLCGRIGNDWHGEEVMALLEKGNIEFAGIVSDTTGTITKTRFVSMNQQVLRVDEEDCTFLTNEEENIILENLKKVIDDVAIVVISDYNKGVCTEELCKSIISISRKKNKMIVVDPKANNWNKYSGATLISPNFKEFCEVIQVEVDNTKEEIAKYSPRLLSQYNIENLLVTRSQYGMMLITYNTENVFRATGREVYDVSGAGDTALGTLAAAIIADYSIVQATEIANVAAGIAVSRQGTYTIKLRELIKHIAEKYSTNNQEKFTQSGFMDWVCEWKEEGQKIVFTNGCFDIIHAGHVTYLEEAKKLGDKLIIGVNSDASVRRLKGSGRPIHTQTQRIKVLEGLQCVDAITVFEEDTPHNLIKAIQPDVLVKGGDYEKEEIVGREFAKEVILIPIVAGCSTTNIINKILN